MKLNKKIRFRKYFVLSILWLAVVFMILFSCGNLVSAYDNFVLYYQTVEHDVAFALFSSGIIFGLVFSAIVFYFILIFDLHRGFLVSDKIDPAQEVTGNE